MNNQLLELEGISDEKAAVLIDHFTGFYDIAADWKAKAEAIKVTGTDQVAEMKMARTGRLFLKDKRVAIENLRKKLKEESLREGQAIDRVARELKGLIEPIENYLETQEKYAEIKEAERLQALRNVRTPVLLELGYQLSAGDPSSYTEEEYIQLIDSLKAVKAAREEAERVEQERQEREQREDAEKRERERKELEELRLKQAEQALKDRISIEKQKELEKKLAEQQAEIDRMQKEKEAEAIKATLPTEEERREALELLDGIFGNPLDGIEPGVVVVGDGLTRPPRVPVTRMDSIRFALEVLSGIDKIDGELQFTGGFHRSTIQGMIERLGRPELTKIIISIEI